MSSAEGVHSIIRLMIQYSSITVLFYDYALTWTREVKFFWSRKFKISTALYIACRYAMVSNILYTLALSDMLPGMRVCDNAYKICSAISVVGRSAIIIVWGARTYAVFNRNKCVLVVFGTLGLLVIGLDISHVPGVVCVGNSGNPIVEELLIIFMVVYEVLSAILTTVRSWQAMKISITGAWRSQRQKLSYLVLREGLLYSIFVSATTLGALILRYTRAQGSLPQRLLNADTLPISGLLTARFLLHLREWDHKASESTSDDWSPEAGQKKSPIQFVDFIDPNREPVQRSIVDEFGEDPVLRARRERASNSLPR
ncbi:hypothetical protein GALMADRAFT_272569 [Galerina marginata CBS 339.88]|uniref:DUF6533 domain-containing protein n=1 Tax=Galerina marginata (strain CBS 339.88) TaxID=685588 RepID=A0A067SNH8_GALM3|nr:hypothetical protein GALMADRAFT_272569 [Galerina marginata CBS 339.88]